MRGAPMSWSVREDATASEPENNPQTVISLIGQIRPLFDELAAAMTEHAEILAKGPREATAAIVWTAEATFILSLAQALESRLMVILSLIEDEDLD